MLFTGYLFTWFAYLGLFACLCLGLFTWCLGVLFVVFACICLLCLIGLGRFDLSVECCLLGLLF